MLGKKAIAAAPTPLPLQTISNGWCMKQPLPIPNGYGIETFPQLSGQLGFAIGGAPSANPYATVSRSKKVILITNFTAI